SGENADRFSAAKGTVVPDLEMVANRMDDASRALNRFVPAMANSQALARTALFRAREARDNLVRANAALDEETRERKAAEAASTVSRPRSPGWTTTSRASSRSRSFWASPPPSPA